MKKYSLTPSIFISVRKNLIIIFGLILVASFFSSNMVAARWAATSSPPFAMAFWRWFLVALLLMPISYSNLRSNWLHIKSNTKSIFICGLLGMGLCGAPIYIAAHSTTAINIGLIMSVSPIVVFMVTAIRNGCKVKTKTIMGLLLGIGGVFAILTNGQLKSFSLVDNLFLGDIVAIASMFAWSAYTMIQPGILPKLSFIDKITLFSLVGVIVTAPFFAYETAALSTSYYSWNDMLFYLFLGVVPGTLAYSGYGLLIHYYGAFRSSLIMYMTPITTGLLAFVFLHEPIGRWYVIGTGLVLTGMAISR